jgi:hypothetical protein
MIFHPTARFMKINEYLIANINYFAVIYQVIKKFMKLAVFCCIFNVTMI